jgi:hypothetical protein
MNQLVYVRPKTLLERIAGQPGKSAVRKRAGPVAIDRENPVGGRVEQCGAFYKQPVLGSAGSVRFGVFRLVGGHNLDLLEPDSTTAGIQSTWPFEKIL